MSASPLVDVFSWTCDWARASGYKLWANDETSSTNAIAKDDTETATRPVLLTPSSFSGPSVYLAKRQSAGRGRGTHTWTTPDGSALLSSWSFAVKTVPQPIFSALVGLALFEACTQIWPEVGFNIKAPNDLYIDDKKVAGILIETVDQGHEKRTVIGVGLNASGSPENVPTATDLSEHLKRASGRDLERSEWVRFLETWVRELTTAVAAGLESRLQPTAAARLCRALNLHPLLKEPILQVDEFGQLHSATRVIHWHEL